MECFLKGCFVTEKWQEIVESITSNHGNVTHVSRRVRSSMVGRFNAAEGPVTFRQREAIRGRPNCNPLVEFR
jgi:hypothetical protein